MRATTLKASPADLGNLLAYYAGLADDQARRDGAGRGPIDYYLDPAEPAGRWWGGGRGALGLADDVQPEELEALFRGRHPGHGGRLGRGFGATSARAFDATFSAPKSVSVLWALSPDPFVRTEVLASHDTAVTAALDWLEHHGGVTRRGRNGVHQVDTRGLVAALFRQHTSRSADPQLHTHAIIAGRVQDTTGVWLCLDARFLKRQQRSIGWIYAAALRSELTARLCVSWGPVTEGHADIVGVPATLLREFSKRSEQVEAALASGSPPGWKPTTVPSPIPARSIAWNDWPCSTAGRTRNPSATPRLSGPSGASGQPRPESTRWNRLRVNARFRARSSRTATRSSRRP